MAFIGIVGLGLILCIWLGSGAMAYAVVVGPIVLVIMTVMFLAFSSANIMAKIVAAAVAFGGTGLVLRSVADSIYSPWDSTQPFLAFMGIFEIAGCLIVAGFIMYFFDDELHR